MHELAIARRIVATAEAAAAREGATRVRCVGVRLGALAGVDPDALRFGFEVARAGTRLSDATLELDRTGARARCARCDLEFEVGPPFAVARCPACRSPSGELVRGRELDVAWMEVV